MLFGTDVSLYISCSFILQLFVFQLKRAELPTPQIQSQDVHSNLMMMMMTSSNNFLEVLASHLRMAVLLWMKVIFCFITQILYLSLEQMF